MAQTLIADSTTADSTTAETSGCTSVSFRAMGSAIEVTLWGEQNVVDQLIDLVPVRLEILEQSWSRFREDSELSRNNRHSGHGELQISEDFLELVTAMKRAAELTNELFNPTMARVMDALGYSVDFSGIAMNKSPVTSLPVINASSGIHLHGNHLSLDSGIALDPGALGKGLAGDVLCREFLAAGAQGVLANIGGDVVASGVPGSDFWRIGVVNEVHKDQLLALVETDHTHTGSSSFAVATSTTARRVWGEGLHHVIDPRTGTVSSTDLVQATVTADHGWLAEAYATAAMVLGFCEAQEFLNNTGISYFLVRKNGEVAFA